MANALVISTKETDRMIAEQNKRCEIMATETGRKQAAAEMVKVLNYLSLSGYKVPSGDVVSMSKVWADQLSEVIADYGFVEIKKAVREYVRNDNREYRQLPNTGQIIAVCKAKGINPKIKKSKLEQIKREIDYEIRVAGRTEEEAVAKIKSIYGEF